FSTSTLCSVGAACQDGCWMAACMSFAALSRSAASSSLGIGARPPTTLAQIWARYGSRAFSILGQAGIVGNVLPALICDLNGGKYWLLANTLAPVAATSAGYIPICAT